MNGETAWRLAESLAAWAWRASWHGAVLAVVVALLLWAVGRRISPGIPSVGVDWGEASGTDGPSCIPAGMK